MRYKRTLITGGRGLVGSAIESEYKPTKKGLNLLNYDDIVRYITRNEIDSIIHCAAKVGGIKANTDQVADFYDENILMNTNLLRAAHTCDIEKVVSFMSTCVFPDNAEYPLTPCQIHLGEPHPSNYGYAYAKRMLEVQSRAYRDQHGRNYVNVIPCNIYGPHDNFNLNTSHVIPALIRKCFDACARQQGFEVWGTGKALREFVYSKDIARIVLWVLENYDDAEPLILSPDDEISIANIAEIIAEELKYEGEIVYTGGSDGQLRKPSDNQNLKYLMDDLEFISLRQGLKETINWYIKTECEAQI